MDEHASNTVVALKLTSRLPERSADARVRVKLKIKNTLLGSSHKYNAIFAQAEIKRLSQAQCEVGANGSPEEVQEEAQNTQTQMQWVLKSHWQGQPLMKCAKQKSHTSPNAHTMHASQRENISLGTWQNHIAEA